MKNENVPKQALHSKLYAVLVHILPVQKPITAVFSIPFTFFYGLRLSTTLPWINDVWTGETEGTHMAPQDIGHIGLHC